MKTLTFTIGGWFDTLPSYVRRQFLRNMEEDYQLSVDWNIRLAGQHWRV